MSIAQAPSITASIRQALQFWKMLLGPGRASSLRTQRHPEAEPVRREGRGPCRGEIGGLGERLCRPIPGLP